MTRAIDVVRTLAPTAKPNYVAAFAQGDGLLIEQDITTPDRLAHFLAQVLHETGGLALDRENMSYSAERLCEVFGEGRHSAAITPAEAERLAHNPASIAERVYGLGNPRKAQELGNTQPADGFRYRGGGLLQTTGRANYRRMGAECGVDFESVPELIVSPDHALKPALAEWRENRLNAFADSNDLLSISRAINLGNPRSERAPNGLQDRATWFARVRPLIDRVDFDTASAAPAAQPEPAPSPPPATGPETGLADRLAGRVLRLGDSGALVQDAQRALARLGADLKGTGYFGPATERAVRDFQEAHALTDDGEFGPETAAALDAALAGSVDGAPRVLPGAAPITLPAGQSGLACLLAGRVLRLGDSGPLVQAVQLALAKLGYDLKGTGFFGGATDTAVTDFQQRHALTVDGEVGRETATAIDLAIAGATPAPDRPSLPPQAASDRPIWLIEGLKWINTQEAPGPADNPEILDWARAEGGAIAASYNHDSIPWCSLYANMVLTKVGLRGTETLWALDWANWGIALPGSAVGAFAPMTRDGGGHIAIVVGRDQHGNLMCLGGNQSDCVNIKPFPAARPVSFRWPKDVPPPACTGFEQLPLVRSDGQVSRNEA